MDIDFIWLLGDLVSALAAWDLEQFFHRMAPFPKNDTFLILEKNHFRRLMSVLVPGTILALLVPRLTLELTFSWALILGLLLIYGLSRTVKYLRRESD